MDARIPKIAHFHWTGGRLPRIRLASIGAFKNLNPEWEIRLHDTPADIRRYGLQYCQEADWTWWRKLTESGGFAVSTDIAFIRSIPDEWLEYDLNACLDDTDRIQQLAMIGAIPNHPLMLTAELECAKLARHKPNTDQAMGIILFARLRELYGESIYQQPMKALCGFSSADASIAKMWSPERIIPHSDAIGLHWYGGNWISKENEPSARPGGASLIERLLDI